MFSVVLTSVLPSSRPHRASSDFRGGLHLGAGHDLHVAVVCEEAEEAEETERSHRGQHTCGIISIANIISCSPGNRGQQRPPQQRQHPPRAAQPHQEPHREKQPQPPAPPPPSPPHLRGQERGQRQDQEVGRREPIRRRGGDG